MLTPEELKVLPKEMRSIYQQFEEFVIKDMARRIEKASKVTETAQWQAERTEALGISKGHIQQELAKTLNKSEKEIADLFYEAAYMSISQENKIY
ncbi:MAG: phage minor capsid protein, partial [Culicoidibacterales bacterium]